jgi:anaerobic dimethyl sulfoxide reductase subunit B (iron-sulfur subunit)
MQLGFYFDQSRCIGCHTCVIACKDWHDVPAGPANWRRVTTIEKGKYPQLFVAFLSLSCMHCAKPTCIPACPVNAISKRKEDGVVIVDTETCLGNKECALFCLDSCPYDAPQFGAEDGAKMQMCDLCSDRIADGRKPICVEACPARALDAGPLDKLKAKYGSIRETEGFVFVEDNKPSILFKDRRARTSTD